MAGLPGSRSVGRCSAHLQAGRSYEVGATEYGGPDDPSSSSYGSIPDPSQSYLPAHPDTFAELSVLSSNPANHGSFTFDDANSSHAFMYVGGLRFDTVSDRSYDTGPNSGKSGARWRVYPSVPGWASWTVRHPPGL